MSHCGRMHRASRPASFLSPSAVSRTGVVTRPLHLLVFQRSQYSPILQPYASSVQLIITCAAQLYCARVSCTSHFLPLQECHRLHITREQHPVIKCPAQHMPAFHHYFLICTDAKSLGRTHKGVYGMILYLTPWCFSAQRTYETQLREI